MSVALAVLAIALGTLVGSVFWAMRLEDVNAETAAASQRLRAILETLGARPIEETFATYNDDPNDDPVLDHDALAALAGTDPVLVIGKRAPPRVMVSFPENAGGLDPEQTTLLTIVRLEWDGATGPRAIETTTRLRNR